MTYRKYHNLVGSIDDTMLTQLREILNDRECFNHVIYVASRGGSNLVTELMVSMIKHYNHLNSSKRCVIIAYGQLMSNGFNICFMLPKSCIKYTGSLSGMIHKVRVDAEITSGGKYYSLEDKAKEDFVSYIHGEDIKLLKRIGVSNSHLKSLEAGKEVYFSHSEMVELFKRNGIKKFN